jgi:glucuronokinase
MKLIRHKAFARAGLVGNPSDGFGGKTISISIRNFHAEATLYPWEDLELLLSQDDKSRFGSIAELVRDVEQHGYYGGIRLVKATVKKFHDYCRCKGHPLHDRNFSVRYRSTIPRQVGLAGSSAIVVAVLRCLKEFYQVEIPMHLEPSLVLAVETEELNLPAGLQDRVREGMVGMDFTRLQTDQATGLRFGEYQRIDPSWEIPLYLAYRPDAGKPLQHDLKQRFDRGDPQVLAAIDKFRQLTDRARLAIEQRNLAELARCMNENFDTRASIVPIRDDHRMLVEAARNVGASAKFAGSGGAIIGTIDDETMYRRLEETMQGQRCVVFRPVIFPPGC